MRPVLLLGVLKRQTIEANVRVICSTFLSNSTGGCKWKQHFELNPYKRGFWICLLRCAYGAAHVRPESGGLLVSSRYHDSVRPALPWNGFGSVGSCFGRVHSVHLSRHSGNTAATKISQSLLRVWAVMLCYSSSSYYYYWRNGLRDHAGLFRT